MLRVLCQIESVTPITFNKKLKSEKEGNESWDKFEERVWRERCDDLNGDGCVVISNQKFKKSICTGAKWLNIKIEGEGQSRYQKLFNGAVVIPKGIDTKIKIEDMAFDTQWVGHSKSSKKWINFPIIYTWNGELEINVLDEKITEEIFTRVFAYSGMCVGVGSWRPENGGENGRYRIADMAFETIESSF